MKQHEIDPLSLFAGLVFSLIAVGYAVSQLGNVNLHWVAVFPAALIAIGATILAFVVRRMRPAAVPETSPDV